MSDEIPVKESELDELKREMRSAQWTNWVESNRKQLTGVAAAVLVVLIAVGFWIENERSLQATAATIYQQAMSEADQDKKRTLLESLNRDFSGSSYSALALMHLAGSDLANAEVHLNALISHSKAMPEWVWQARLDLAEIKIAAGDMATAKSLLDQQIGKQYQQLRYYLLAQTSSDESEKQDYLQKAKDAPSANDAGLSQKIDSQLKNAS